MHLVDSTLFYSPTSGGVKRYLTAKHAWLAAHTSWEHTIIVPGDVDHVERGGVCTLAGGVVPGTLNYRMPLDPRRWTRLMSALEPSLLEAGDPFHPAWCAWHVARSRGIPLVAFYHSNIPQMLGSGMSSRAIARYIRWLYDRFDLVFAPSRLMCNFLQELGIRHTALQPHGVDAELFHPRRRDPRLRETLGLPPDTRLLVYVGRFAREKNLPLLLRSFADLGAPYHLLMIGGNGALERPQPSVTVIPYRRDSLELARWIASADALVHAGTQETFGLVALEAMACGRPVVAARAGALPELVDESVGVLAEPGSARSLAEAIVALYERDVDGMGARARARVQRRFTWNIAFQTQTVAYARLLGLRRTAFQNEDEEPAVEVR
jgi:alpha-1,6-mannosyltransferase